ncbi:HET-domain-containing protein, partial [Alternaria alternata]
SGTFKHDPLSIDERSIRLITIEPNLSQPDGLIQWGDPEPRKLILINGKEASIQTNLFDFLDTVRATNRDAIWIDALCINQNDSMEKNHQVSQMGEIYSGAQCVYAWLGLPIKRPTGCGNLLECVMNFTRHDHHHELWLLTNLFNNEYWKRCWIIQEIALALHVVVLLGPDSCDFSQLVEAASRPKVYESQGITFYRRSYGSTSSVFAQFSKLNIGRSQFVAKGLIPLLADFSKTRSTLTHDRIFALVPLCREKASFEIDYNLSIRDLIYETLTSC